MKYHESLFSHNKQPNFFVITKEKYKIDIYILNIYEINKGVKKIAHTKHQESRMTRNIQIKQNSLKYWLL